MNIALIAEGVSEYRSMPLLYPQFHDRTGHRIVATMKMSVSPLAPEPVIVRQCLPLLAAAEAKSVDLVVLVLDREQRDSCPGAIAASLESAIGGRCLTALTVKVVIKDRAYENWLIADLAAIQAQPRRFNVSRGLVRAVEPNKADACDAQGLLRTAAVNRTYEKVDDSVRICRRMDVGKAALNSRSFRRLLRVIEDVHYLDQSVLPNRAI